MFEHIAIADLLPHAGPMVLLDKLLEVSDGHIICGLKVRSDGLFDELGKVPSWLGMEYMAQSIAAYSGYHSQLKGEPARLGFLLGSRRFETTDDHFYCGQWLQVRAEVAVRGESGLAAFECLLEGDAGLRQQATLSVFEPADGEAYLEGVNA